MYWAEVVESLGVSVTEDRLPYGWWGLYLVEHHLIVLSPELGPVQKKSTLAHECGHAYYRHDGTSQKEECQASRWAVKRLINESEFIDALRITDECRGLAQILGVMPTDVETYVASLTKIEKMLIRQMLESGHQREREAS